MILSALKKGGSGLMEVDEEKNKIRRCPTLPLPEWNDARREELMNNTVYVKGDYRFQNAHEKWFWYLHISTIIFI